MSSPVVQVESPHHHKLEHAHIEDAMVLWVQDPVVLTNHPQDERNVRTVGKGQADAVVVAFDRDAAGRILASQGNIVYRSRTLVDLHANADALAVPVHRPHSNCINDIDGSGEELVVGIDAGTGVCHQVKPFSRLSVNFIAQGESLHVQNLELGVRHAYGNSEERVSTDCVVH